MLLFFCLEQVYKIENRKRHKSSGNQEAHPVHAIELVERKKRRQHS